MKLGILCLLVGGEAGAGRQSQPAGLVLYVQLSRTGR